MLVSISKGGIISIVISRTKSTIRYITTLRNKRKIIKERTQDFDKYNSILPLVTPEKVAILWLASPLNIAPEARKELNMIVAMNKNKVVGKFETTEELPEGTEAISSPQDLEARSLRSLNALYNKLNPPAEDEDGTLFATVEEATQAVWDSLEALEIPTKEKKVKEKAEKTPRQLVVRSEPPSIDSDTTVFQCKDSTRMKKDGRRFAIYQFIEANGPSTVAQIAEGLTKPKSEVASDIRNMTVDNKVSVV